MRRCVWIAACASFFLLGICGGKLGQEKRVAIETERRLVRGIAWAVQSGLLIVNTGAVESVCGEMAENQE